MKAAQLDKSFSRADMPDLVEYIEDRMCLPHEGSDRASCILSAGRFLFWCARKNGETVPCYSYLNDQFALNDWVKEVRETLTKASTIRNYVTSLGKAAEFYQEVFGGGERYKHFLSRSALLKNQQAKLRKPEDIARQALDTDAIESLDPTTFGLVLTHDANTFRFRSIMAKFDSGLSINVSDFSFATNLAAAHMLIPNAQRPGAAINMTVHEYETAKREGDMYVIDVRKHKTGASGPARLVIDAAGKDVLADYLRIRNARRPDPRPSFLITKNGKKVSKISERFQRLCENCGLEGNMPTVTVMRKAITSYIHNTGTIEDAKNLAKQMTHSPLTACKNYASRNLAQTVTGAALVRRAINFSQQ